MKQIDVDEKLMVVWQSPVQCTLTQRNDIEQPGVRLDHTTWIIFIVQWVILIVYIIGHSHRTICHRRILNTTEPVIGCQEKYSNKNILRAGCITPQCGITFMAIDRRISARLMSFRL